MRHRGRARAVVAEAGLLWLVEVQRLLDGWGLEECAHRAHAITRPLVPAGTTTVAVDAIARVEYSKLPRVRDQPRCEARPCVAEQLPHRQVVSVRKLRGAWAVVVDVVDIVRPDLIVHCLDGGFAAFWLSAIPNGGELAAGIDCLVGLFRDQALAVIPDTVRST